MIMRKAIYGIAGIAGAFVSGALLFRQTPPVRVHLPLPPAATPPALSPAAPERIIEPGGLERRVASLASQLTAETAARRAIEQRLDTLQRQLAGGHSPGGTPGNRTGSEPHAAAAPSAPAPSSDPSPAAADDAQSPLEHALIAAGIDPATAAEIKQRGDELTLAEIYLRDRASREGWLDTPHFTDEMQQIDQQRVSIRDQIGDDAYDRYLAALDQPNRVAVQDVLVDSPAAEAGLQAGDVVLRYGDTRIFSPNELVSATHSGIAGEMVSVEILRQGQPLELQVPRGPLGVQVAASRSGPGQS